MKRFHLLLLLLFAFTATTCSKESDLQCTEANTNKILPHAWDFFFFKTGSWWIYEEENTGERDSIWVGFHEILSDNVVAAKIECDCGKGKCIQSAVMRVYSSMFEGKKLYGYRLDADLIEGKAVVGEGAGVYDNFSGNRIRYVDYSYLVKSPTNGTYEDIDSIVVKGIVYRDILHHSYTQTENIPDWQHEAWYARNIYLVRYRLFDGTTWNLIKYHVIK